MPQEVSSQVTIDIPQAEAWAKLKDLSLAHNYVPGLMDTRIVSQQREGVGTSRYVYRSAKNYIQETVTDWRDGEGFTIRLHKGDKSAPPFKEAWFRYELEPLGAHQTHFTASLGYTMPWGGFGDWLGKHMQSLVAKTVADVAIAMKLYYETGEPTTPSALKAYKASDP